MIGDSGYMFDFVLIDFGVAVSSCHMYDNIFEAVRITTRQTSSREERTLPLWDHC